MGKKHFILGIITCLLVVNLSMFNTSVKAATTLLSSGKNDAEKLNPIITDLLDNAPSDPWRDYLNQEFLNSYQSFSWNKNTGVEDTWKWKGQTAALGTGDPTTDPDSAPKANGGVTEVYSVQQLITALGNSKNIKIMKDLDFVGYEYNWNYNYSLTDTIIDGNDKILYNIGSTKSFIDSMIRSQLKKITFDSAKIVSSTAKKSLGIVGDFTDRGNGKSVLDHVRVQNSLFFSAALAYDQCYVSPFGKSENIKADYVATVNNIVYGYSFHAGGTFGISNHSVIENSYSVDSTVIAGGNHSGGFISCADGALSVKNSFTNNTVYGNSQTGVFIGAILPQISSSTTSFENCFSSGTIEGQRQLGGFIGVIEEQYDGFGDHASDFFIDMEKCYSTSIVGMRAGGEDLGGFVGAILRHRGNTTYTFKDCYAAGEVGAIDTDIRPNRGISTVGGFIGTLNVDNSNVFKNCYYDKQTTAMREWATGNTGTNPAGSRDYIDENDKGIANIEGIKGVLTSDADKFGKGLASQPRAINDPTNPQKTTGFTGFVGDTYAGQIASNTNWIYDGGNKKENSHNCMYPQLSVFFNSSDAFVRAYSYASVSTVHEQVWQGCTHGYALPKTTYDTVRDLTMRFTLTSYVDNGIKEDVKITWSKTDEKTQLYGQDKNVIDLFGKMKNTKYNRDYWTADKFAPGTEWVTVKFSVKDDATQKTAVGSRRLRIIPTSNIQSGNDNLDIVSGGVYNHAEDAYFAYSTAKRMSDDANDITTGVYPDAFPFGANDPRNSIQKERIVNGKSIQSIFTQYDNKYQVSAEYLTDSAGGIEKTHKDNIINVYLYDVKSFKETQGNISEIIYIEDGKTKEQSAVLSPKLLEDGNTEALSWAEKLNGTKEFETKDQGRYLIEYEWIMPDGRYMRDSKMIMVQAGQHDVSIDVKNMDGSVNDKSMKLSINSYNHGETIPEKNFGKTTVSSLDKKVDHFDAVDLGFKNVNENATIKKIQFDITTPDPTVNNKTKTITFDNVKIGDKLKVPTQYYYSSFEDNGRYYAKLVETVKEYTLEYDTTNEYYYLTMDKEFNDAETGLKRYDLESDVKVTIYVDDSKAINRGTTTISSKTFENGAEIFTSDEVKYVIKDDKGNIVQEITLTSLKDSSITVDLPIGDYTIERLDNDKYDLKDIVVEGKSTTTKVADFTILLKKDIKIVINNLKKTADTPALDPTPTPPTQPTPPVNKDDEVETGDQTQDVIVYVGLIGFAALLGIVLVRKSKRNKKD